MPKPSRLHSALRREPSKEYRRETVVMGKLKKGRATLQRVLKHAFGEELYKIVYIQPSEWGRLLDEFDREMLACERKRIVEKGGAAL
jgi:hypothetical protein